MPAKRGTAFKAVKNVTKGVVIKIKPSILVGILLFNLNHVLGSESVMAHPAVAEAQTPDSGKVIVAIAPSQSSRMQSGDSFGFRHSLATRQLITLDGVAELIRYYQTQKRYDLIYSTVNSTEIAPQNALDAVTALKSSEYTNTWIRLTQVDDTLPEIRDATKSFIQDLSDLHGRNIEAEVFKPFVTLFVSSPGEVTPYHFDHTWNFLLQLKGTKTVYLFDQNDPQVLRQTDQENWYGRNCVPAKDENSGDGIPYFLRPGDGVHHPVNAPHWVQNGPEISISLSIGLCLHESNRRAKIHQVNYILRKLGLSPPPPSPSNRADRLKLALMDIFSDRQPGSFQSAVFSGRDRVMLPYRATRKVFSILNSKR
jgi:cupin-like protein